MMIRGVAAPLWRIDLTRRHLEISNHSPLRHWELPVLLRVFLSSYTIERASPLYKQALRTANAMFIGIDSKSATAEHFNRGPQQTQPSSSPTRPRCVQQPSNFKLYLFPNAFSCFAVPLWFSFQRGSCGYLHLSLVLPAQTWNISRGQGPSCTLLHRPPQPRSWHTPTSLQDS